MYGAMVLYCCLRYGAKITEKTGPLARFPQYCIYWKSGGNPLEGRGPGSLGPRP